MTFVQWIITTGATVGAFGIIFQTLVRPVYKWARRLEQTMSFVEQQMHPNGGVFFKGILLIELNHV
mgnify:CR=1 FL=1